MKKKFNTTGLCIPEKHYMADISAKIQAIFKLVEDGSYFVINRPRQYGKTTTLYLLERKLHEHEYFPMFISFEGISSESYQYEQRFIEAFLSQLRMVFSFYKHHELLALVDKRTDLTSLTHLGNWMTELVNTAEKQIVLMIDEVDKSSNNQLFLDFLALLRTKYLLTNQGKDATFQSVILAGVHDVKSLKLRLRPDEERKYNSPWNIAVNFTVDLSLFPHEIETMLQEYCTESGVTMDQAMIAQKLYDYTSGYPFLVSALCQIIDEEVMEAQTWTSEDVEQAVNNLLMLENTNFESLIKNLENHPELYELVEQIVLFDEQLEYNQDNPAIHLGVLYGILRRNNTLVAIHNRIYQERIYNYMTINLRLQLLKHSRLGDYTSQSSVVRSDGMLDFEEVLRKFQDFMKQEYSQRDTPFIERNGRLVFLAFLKPIINGQGYDFKEPQISEEKRLDVVVTWLNQKYVIELKIWRGETKHQQGLQQLHDYLDRTGLDSGYLVIFDLTQKGQKSWKQEHLQIHGKNIFAVWV